MAAAGMSRALIRSLNELLKRKRYRSALAVIKGFRNGAVYGAKIRAPHALVMTFLFKTGSLQEKLKAILQATFTHSRNLACFVFTYKGLLAAQEKLHGGRWQFHSFLAACVGGWLVFGENNHINSQTPWGLANLCAGSCKWSHAGSMEGRLELDVPSDLLHMTEEAAVCTILYTVGPEINMYLLSRVLFGLCRLAVERGYIPEPKHEVFPLFSALVWGFVLWLFEYHRHTLQPSLQSSMTYLYDDSNIWHDIQDFLIYNKAKPTK